MTKTKAHTERFVIVGDSHGYFIHPGAAKDLADFCKDFKPSVRFHVGDAFDMTCLRAGAHGEDEYVPLEADIAMGLEFLRWFQPDVFMYGNHEHRLFTRLRDNREIVRDHAQSIVSRLGNAFKEIGCKTVFYNSRSGVYPYGDYKIIHGYSAGKFYVAHHAAKYGKCFVGHGHTLERCKAETYATGIAYGVGCLCDYDKLHYCETQTNRFRWERGWVFGYRDTKTGAITAYQHSCEEGRWTSL